MPKYDSHRDCVDLLFSTLGTWLQKYSFVSKPGVYCILVSCQSIVCLSLLYDVLYLNQFYYFYRALILIIISTVIQYILYSIEMLIETNLASLESVIEVGIIVEHKLNLETMNTENFKKLTPRQYVHIVMYAQNSGIDTYTSCKIIPDYIKMHPNINESVTLNYCLTSLQEFTNIYYFLASWEIFKKYYVTPFNISKYFIYSYCWGFITWEAFQGFL